MCFSQFLQFRFIAQIGKKIYFISSFKRCIGNIHNIVKFKFYYVPAVLQIIITKNLCMNPKIFTKLGIKFQNLMQSSNLKKYSNHFNSLSIQSKSDNLH